MSTSYFKSIFSSLEIFVANLSKYASFDFFDTPRHLHRQERLGVLFHFCWDFPDFYGLGALRIAKKKLEGDNCIFLIDFWFFGKIL